MLSEPLRTRLRQLNQSRRLLKRATATSAARAAVPPAAGQPAAASGRLDSPRCRLAAGHAVANRFGEHWLVQYRLDEIWPAWQTCWQPGKPPAAACSHAATLGPDYQEFRKRFPQGSLFLDLETCGFAGSAIFLAGTIHWQNSQLWLSQFWARSYAEEAALLYSLASLLQHQELLVTFNGKSFDWPQVRDRTILFRGAVDSGLPELPHLDLLHLCRRRWKHTLPNCKLQTLERFICGRLRTGDIPGHQIPEAYHAYVRTCDSRQVDTILHHNALDLVTLLQLALTAGTAGPGVPAAKR